MKKVIGKIVIVIIFIGGFIMVDWVAARKFNTKPLIAIQEDVSLGGINTGKVYKSLFANVYYCNTVVDSYDDNNKLVREEKTIRYYMDKDEIFTCKSSLDMTNDRDKEYYEADKKNDLEYMKYLVKDLYDNKLDNLYSINTKMNKLIYNFVGTFSIDSRYRDIYMFDLDNLMNNPVKLEIDGFDMTWRSLQVSSSESGNIMAFYYNCGYHKEQWMGEQKYTSEDCEKNRKENGIYVFYVNGVNDYKQLAYYSEDNNEYIDEYRDSYFVIDMVISDEELVIKYVLTNDRQLRPDKEVLKVWNFIDNTTRDYNG